MKITIQEIRNLCMKILLSKGLSQKDAETVFEEYLDGELRGRRCHGFSAFVKFGAKLIGDRTEPEILKETESLIVLDGGNNLGQIVMRDYVPKLIEKTKKSGIGMLGISNMHSYLMPGTFVRRAAEKDMILIACNYGGRERIAPAGSIDPIFATNPLAVGIPTNNLPIVIDMATSSIAMGMVRLAKKLGEPIEKGAAIDKNGKPTCDPSKVIEGALFPFGGYKGSALALIIEVLTRSMFGYDFGEGKRGFLLICIDPSFFGGLKEFKENVSDIISRMKNTRKADGIDEIFFPGEKSEITKKENSKKGYLNIDEKIIEEIENSVS